MKRVSIFFLILTSLLIYNSCDSELNDPEVKSILYQIPGCNNIILSKSNEVKLDSCFTYSFTDKLAIDFCAAGNCCPDKNRFSLASNIYKDSIVISVSDTAKNLCKCICNYIIRAEFEDLPGNSYLLKCYYKEPAAQKILYSYIAERKLK